MCKEYQGCIDQWQQALECEQHEHNKMVKMKDVYKELLDEAENKPKGKYCCEVCGARLKTNLSLLIHMRKHR